MLFEHHLAATVIQAWMRGEWTREWAWGEGGLAEQAAALLIQKAFRGRKGFRLARDKRFFLRTAAACTAQRSWRCFAAKRKRQKLRQILLFDSVVRIQSAVRGWQGRKEAKRLREIRERTMATRIQRMVRGLLGRRAFERERHLELNRQVVQKELSERAASLTMFFKHKIDKISDRQIVRSETVQHEIVRYAMLQFAFRGEVDLALQLLSRVLRCNSDHQVASLVKVIVLLSSGGRPIYQNSKHAYFFVERALDLLDAPQTPGRVKSLKSFKESNAHFADLGQFFFLCARAKASGRDSFRASMNFALVLQCLPNCKDLGRSQLYWARANDALEGAQTWCSGDMLHNNLSWVKHLGRQFVAFWDHAEVHLVSFKDMSVSTKGDAVIVRSPSCSPLVVASQRQMREISGLDGNARPQQHARAMLRFVQKIRVRMSARPQLMIPFLQKARTKEVDELRKHHAALCIQAAGRGMLGRIVWRRLAKIREVLQQQELFLVEQRLQRLRIRQARRRAITRLQSLWRGHLARVHVQRCHLGATQMQRAVRGHLGRVHFGELERRMRMGALVKEVYAGGRRIPVDNVGAATPMNMAFPITSECQVFLQVLKSGNNFVVSGVDLCTAEEYRGTLPGHHVEGFLRRFNQGRACKEKVRITQAGQVLELILSHLRLVPPIKALGDLTHAEASRTFVLAHPSSLVTPK
ncbi:Uncharacterized protein SCF082_LOCUS48823 [Durusdinium trenchii]|uniref:Uncharacterized protein n=1 Tax=Durusdinium trenchii TaxID=1381693 RepID=A0ABP0RXJ3_9DINO